MYTIDLIFFFFQAEDGIRDVAVTGVQTCALPISGPRCHDSPRADGKLNHDHRGPGPRPALGHTPGEQRERSEERRVGKECRSRRSTGESKKKRQQMSNTQRCATVSTTKLATSIAG